VVIAAAVLVPICRPARADDPGAKAILDKAIKALGGEEKLAKIEAFSWKAKVMFGPTGREMDAELSEHNDFGEIKKATQIEVISIGFGSGFSQVITDFHIQDKVDDSTFAKPE
jgi:hypothetical protein